MNIFFCISLDTTRYIIGKITPYNINIVIILLLRMYVCTIFYIAVSLINESFFNRLEIVNEFINNLSHIFILLLLSL